MVSIRYRKQQAEEEARKLRLVAARQAASSRSLQQARQYAVQKTNQSSQVRRELQTRWAMEQQEKAMAVSELLEHADAHRAEGLEEAARLRVELTDVAREEVSAWSAEHELERARFRLASAYSEADSVARNANALDAAVRRANVRAAEKMRAAKVAASAAASSTAATLADACGGMERFDQVPKHGTPFTPLQVNIPRDKRMSAVAYPPRCTPGEHFRGGRDVLEGLSVDGDDAGYRSTPPLSAADAAVELLREREERRAATEAKLREAQTAASERAERVLQESRAAAERVKQSESNERARRREVAGVYRHPRETEECECDPHDVRPRPHPRDASAFPATHRQRSQQAARDAEEAFVRDFVEGPPVLVPSVPSDVFCLRSSDGPVAESRRGLPVEALMRPARVQDLLTDSPAQTALPAVPMAAQPLIVSIFAQDTPSQPPPDSARDAVPTASAAPIDTPARVAQVTEEASEEVSKAVAPHRDEPLDVVPQTTDGVHNPTAPQETSHAVTQQHPTTAQPSTPLANGWAASAEEADTVELVEVSRVTEPSMAQLSVTTTDTAHDDDDGVDDSTSDTSEPIWAGETSTSTSDAGASRTETTFTSTSSSSMRPTMTAEQLKLALIRLRNRMRTAQI